MSGAARLRQLPGGSSYTIAPGAVDPLTARLVELAGFDAVYLTGGGYSRSQGFPDLGLLTMTEITAWIARVVETVSIPVIGDADTGYGNALNVVRTVREFERTGAAALHLEDQLAPKRCGHYDGKAVISIAEMVGKIKAAVDTRRDERFVIIARTDARAVEGLDAAIERVEAYLAAGADVGFVEAPQSRAELATVADRIKAPLVANIFAGGKTPALPAADLQALGYRLGIYPSQAHRAAIRATEDVLAELRRSGDTAAIEHRLATFADRETAVDTKRWESMEQRYLRDIEVP
jgi:2-methylisocitrate lyase-like PEP mutase family enzyme